MVNYSYLAKFAPNLPEVTAPLRILLKKESDFIWDEAQTRTFNEVKEIITNAPVLGYFDPNKQLVLKTDASKPGLGCCIMQDDKPIAYASKSLTQTECMYAQVDKELLAILYDCKRFHQFTYGREMICQYDHKPIESIMKKPLAAAPPRLQRMLLQKYKITVRHDLHVHSVRKHLFVTNSRLEKARNSIQDIAQMQILKKTILEGWPRMRSECHKDILEFWSHRDELSYEDNMIFRGHTILIPRSIRHEMITLLHKGHLGVLKTLERA